VNIEKVRPLLAEATGGKVATDLQLKAAKVPSAEWGDFRRIANAVAAVARGGNQLLARRFLDAWLEEQADLDATDWDALADTIRTSPSSGVRGLTAERGMNPADHPGAVLLSQVASGRTPPPVEKLVDLGFPEAIAEAAAAEAALVAAAHKGGGAFAAQDVLTVSRRRLVAANPWPEPSDDWGDLQASIPAAKTNTPAEVDPEAIARRITEKNSI
jgi:hypothetical protein